MNESSLKASGQPVPPATWYALSVLTLIYGCNYLDRTVVSLMAEPIRREFLLTDRQLGLLTGLAYGASFALAAIPFGYLIDRVNRRRLLAIVVAIWSAMTMLVAGAQTFSILVIIRCLLGAAEAGGSPAAMSMMSDLFPARLRSTAIGIYYLGVGIGAAASAVIGASVAARYGWRTAFCVAGLPGILLALLVWTTLRDIPRGFGELRSPLAPPLNAVSRFMFGQRAVLCLIAAVSLVSAGIVAIAAWLPPLLMRSHGMGLGGAGLVTALAFGLCSSLGTLAGGVWADRLARRGAARRLWFCAAMALIAIPPAMVAVLSTSTWLAVASVCVFSLAAFTIFPSGFGMALDLMPPEMRGVNAACTQVVSNLVGYGFGPYAVGLVSTSLGGTQSLRQGMAAVCAVTMISAAGVLTLAARWHAQTAARCAAYGARTEFVAVGSGA